MKKGYKECPFCKNEIKEEAIKCQYCHEMLPEEPKEQKEGDTMECPFCKNEIKKEAIKCQYCHEILNKNSSEDKNEKETIEARESLIKSTENHEIVNEGLKSQPSLRGRRFWAAFFDYLIDLTIVGWIYNVVVAFRKGRTFGFDLMGIKFVSEDGNPLTKKQKLGRFLLYWPISAGFIVVIIGGLGLLLNFDSISIITILVYAFGIFNTIEWFFKSPTFYEKKLGIKKYQGGNIKGWGIAVVIVLFLILGRLVKIAQDAQILQHFNNVRISGYDSVINGNPDKGIEAYNQMKDVINNTPNEYSDFYSAIFNLAENHQKDLNSIGSLEIDNSYLKNPQKINQLISNYKKYKNVQNEYVNSIENLIDDLVKKHNLDTTTDAFSGPYGHKAWINNEKKRAKAESDYADFNIEFLSFVLEIQDDFYVDNNGEIYFYEGGYSMNKYNEFIERAVSEENKYNKAYNEYSEFSKARAQYRKSQL